MAQEKKPVINIPSDAKIGPAQPPGWMEWINQNAEGLISAAGMVAGGPGGGAKKAAMKAAPKVAKAAGKGVTKLKSAADINTVPKEVFDEFINFTQSVEPRGGVLGSNLDEIVANLWQAFMRGK